MDPFQTDVVFKVGGEESSEREIRANKLVLSEKSPVFREMFVECLMVPDLEPEAFEAMLSFIYGDEFLVTDDMLRGCLAAAEKYQVEGFAEALLDHFIDKINPGNCLVLLTAGHKLKDAEEYEERVLMFIEKAIEEVIENEEFAALPRDLLAAILVRDGLCITELELFQAVLEWARCECDR